MFRKDPANSNIELYDRVIAIETHCGRIGFVENGVPSKDFDRAYGSFGIDSMVRQAAARTQGARINGTPSLMVNGKYRIDTRQAGSQANMLKIAAFLADKELARLQRAASATD